jgi:hypothetical protein
MPFIVALVVGVGVFFVVSAPATEETVMPISAARKRWDTTTPSPLCL